MYGNQGLKGRYKLILPVLLIPILLAAGYYLITPKVILLNQSETSYAEFVIDLPSSRISFSPVAASSSATILYSQQNQSGASSYTLRQTGREPVAEEFIYPQGSELGRVLRFTITSDGSVVLN